MQKQALEEEIRLAFKGVLLEEGIGLWEAEALDNYADEQIRMQAKAKDERNDWMQIPFHDLSACSASLSYFDAKGMRFCLPRFLLFALLSEEQLKQQNLHPPDLLFYLSYQADTEQQQQRFSLFSPTQIRAVLHFIEYVQQLCSDLPADGASDDSPHKNSRLCTYDIEEIQNTQLIWQKKLNERLSRSSE